MADHIIQHDCVLLVPGEEDSGHDPLCHKLLAQSSADGGSLCRPQSFVLGGPVRRAANKVPVVSWTHVKEP